MTQVITLETNRLILRQWQQNDLVEFSKINADPIVMEYYPNTLNEEQSNNMVNYLKSLITERSWGLWAVEIKNNRQFIGFVGLHEPTHDLPVTPCVEIGWRLAREYWRQGYATEAAEQCLRFAFEQLKLQQVYSFTSVVNKKSATVMARLQMKNMESNFQHPILPENHLLREHVLYKITAEQWCSAYSSNTVF